MNSDDSSDARKVSLSEAAKTQTLSLLKEDDNSPNDSSATSSDDVYGQRRKQASATPPTEATTTTTSTSRGSDELVGTDNIPIDPEVIGEPSATRSSARKPQSRSKPTAAKAIGRTKKSQNAPKRFRSSYIFFAQEKFQEIRADLEAQGLQPKAPEIAKLVSAAWKQAGPSERRKFEVMSEEDKARFEVEKRMYDGPWRAPIGGKREREAGEPKRPMSAFLAFSNIRRSTVKSRMPHATNGEVSKELSRMWKEAPEDVKSAYKAAEKEELAAYKAEMTNWQQVKQQARDDREREAHNIATLQGGNVADSLPGPDESGSSSAGLANSLTNQSPLLEDKDEPNGSLEASLDPSREGMKVGASLLPLRPGMDAASSAAFSLSSDEELLGFYASSSQGGPNGPPQGNSTALSSNETEQSLQSQAQGANQNLAVSCGPTTDNEPELPQNSSSEQGQELDEDSPGTIEGMGNLSHADSVSPTTTLSFPSSASDGA